MNSKSWKKSSEIYTSLYKNVSKNDDILKISSIVNYRPLAGAEYGQWFCYDNRGAGGGDYLMRTLETRKTFCM